MKQPLLVLDSHYLCHRAFHAQKDLSFHGIKTGVIYGFLKQIGYLKNEFQTDRIAFCFEGSTLYRKIDFPGYKMKRIQHEEKADPEKLKARGDLTRQIEALRISYLHKIGFRNVFYYPGWESDDIMGRITQTVEGEIILVTSDADMYQLLKSNVLMFSPYQKKLLTYSWFVREYGIQPWQWAIVKAMSGCDSDGVPGIPGVGETTALKFLRRELNPKAAIYKTIMSREAAAIVNRNRRLIELPYEAVPTPTPEWDETEQISTKGWNDVCAELGIKSMAGRPPVFSSKLLKKEK